MTRNGFHGLLVMRKIVQNCVLLHVTLIRKPRFASTVVEPLTAIDTRRCVTFQDSARDKKALELLLDGVDLLFIYDALFFVF